MIKVDVTTLDETTPEERDEKLLKQTKRWKKCLKFFKNPSSL